MRFLKENSYDIVKLYVNQIGIAIFSMVLNIAVNSMGDKSFSEGLNIAVSVFSILFYTALLYTVTWENGAKDRIRADADKIKFNKAKGMLLALIASIPNAVIITLTIVFGYIYKLTGAATAAVISGASNFFMRFSLSMYHGIIDSVFGGFKSVADASYLGAGFGYLIASLVAVAAVHVGYILGSREFRIFGFLSNKN